MFSVRFDTRRGLVQAARSGFFDIADVGRVRDAVRAALAQAERSGAPFDMLIDNSEGQPLASDVTKAFEHIAADIRASRVRRIVYISPGAVNRIQARRIARADTDPRIRVFENPADAEAWLNDRP